METKHQTLYAQFIGSGFFVKIGEKDIELHEGLTILSKEGYKLLSMVPFQYRASDLSNTAPPLVNKYTACSLLLLLQKTEY